MRAVVQTAYGGAEALELRTAPRPTAGAGEVLIRVHATGVNDQDWALLTGKPFFVRAFNGKRGHRGRILGLDVAGEVVEVGDGVSNLSLGDRVFGDLSERGNGGFAEYLSTAAAAFTRIPDNLSFVDAAALPHAGNLAVQALVDVAKLRPEHRLLVNGAGGGVGPLIAQLASHYGVRDIVGVDDASKQEFMRAVGFTRSLDYRAVDFTRSGERFDVIIDTRMTRSPFGVPRALAPGGIYVAIGATTSSLLGLALWGRLIGRMTGTRLRMLWLKPNASTSELATLAEAGVLKPHIDRVMPLADTGLAMERFGAAQHRGKIVIAVAG
ncbi:NADPH:quinone reductase-like Zn-dependent oxidoreductase [Salinibacterium sp. CAN_S4]|uniref:NAD(P)-dependent alcohol dehydrogenase n=1 Tax=Salinibacterium sp. CAN_S4 TaxID=2787727 RepID=UPI0018F0464D